MISAIARGLVNFAADRWPPHLRDGVRREWLAELAVLTAAGERWTSLRFAASLAAHPGHRPDAARTPVLPRIWYAYRVLLIGPVLCGLLLLISFMATSLSTGLIAMQTLPGDWAVWAMRAQLPSLTLWCLAAAYLAARIGQRWSPDLPGFLLPVLTATVPGFLAVALMYANSTNTTKVMRYLSVVGIYAIGSAAILYVVARLVRSARRRQAWWLGSAGAFVVLDIAVMPAIYSIRLPAEEGAINAAYAPTWLIALLTDTGIGPTAAEVFTMTDVLAGVPQVLIVLTGWALGMVMGVQNRASSSASALATASESPPSTLM